MNLSWAVYSCGYATGTEDEDGEDEPVCNADDPATFHRSSVELHVFAGAAQGCGGWAGCFP